jgi:hypothetical protein
MAVSELRRLPVAGTLWRLDAGLVCHALRMSNVIATVQ